MKLFLIGYMGCGKSAVGTALSSISQTPFVDLDDYIENDIGMSIASIFRLKGETFFRELEQESLDEIMRSRAEFVLATGGGTACFGDAVQRMKAAGKVIYLSGSVDYLLFRLQDSIAKRPLLASKTSEELHAFVSAHLAAREVHYRQADFIVNVEGKTVNEIAQEILDYASK